MVYCGAFMMDFSKILNAGQYEAVTAPEGPMLVLAAAGTGKTHTLVHRVAWLIEQGEAPDRLLLLTFTNRAAREMIERARGVAGEGVGEVWSGTFHHVCNRFLRRFGHHLGFGPGFAILDREESESLVNEAIKGLGYTSKDFPKKGVVAGAFSHAASRGVGFAEVAEDRARELECEGEELLKIYNAYEERKRVLGAMDFDDLLVNGLRLMETVPEVRERYQAKFRHVLVDEYQDTNRPQARLVDVLARGHGNVMAVGDDFQCIYSWRGANFRNIMSFPERYPGCRILKLEENYRSSPEILEVANACIKGNPEQFQKTLRATRPARRKPEVYFLRDGDEQAYFVARRVRRMVEEEGRRPGEIAVLYRAHFHSIELQMTLSRMGMAYEITSGVGVFEQAHTKDVLAFLRMGVNSGDALAFQRLLAMVPGAGPKTVEKWWTKLGGRFDALEERERGALREMMKPAQREAWRPVEALYEVWREKGYMLHGDAAVLQFLADFYDRFLSHNFDNPEKRREDVEELAVHIGRAGTVAEFLNEVALLTNVDHAYARQETGADAVHLSTVHQAKGLEWPVVFVIWMSEGMFPAQRALSEGDDAEERRLFYVALTRAKEALYLSAPEMRNVKGGGMMYMRPSRFVKELPKELLQEHYGVRL